MKIWRATQNFTMTNLVNRTLPERYYQDIDKVKKGDFIYEYENVDKYVINRYTVFGPLDDSWKHYCEFIGEKPEESSGDVAGIEIVDDLNSTSGTAALSANQGRVLEERITNISISGGTDIIDNLNSTLATSALSANQGRVLNERLSTVEQAIDGKAGVPDGGNNGQVLTQTANGPQWQDALQINDSTPSATSTYSSAKIEELIPDDTEYLSEEEGNALYVTRAESNNFATKQELADGLNDKTDYGHSHVIADVRDLNTELSKKLDAPNGGTTGQVIVKTATGAEWADVATNVNVIDSLDSTSGTMALSANQGRVLKGMIDNFTGGTSVTVVDALNSSDATSALSANQGRVLNEKIEAIDVPTVIDNLNSTSGTDALSASQGRILDVRVSGVETVLPTKMDLVSGGTAGQVLTKTDDSYVWADAQGGGASVTVVDGLDSDDATAALSAKQGKVLDGKISGKADSAHTHEIADVNGLQTALDGKMANAANGSAGQVLTKTANAYEWANLPEGITVIDDLTSDDATAALSAKQGKALKVAVDSKLNYVSDDTTSLTVENGVNGTDYTVALKTYVDTKGTYKASTSDSLTLTVNGSDYVLPLQSYLTSGYIDYLVADSAFINALTGNANFIDALVNNQTFIDAVMAKIAQNAVEFHCDDSDSLASGGN